MENKPTPLFLVLIAGIGTALLSPITVNGEPIIVFIIPLALVAAYWYKADEGVIVAAGGALLAGIALFTIQEWTLLTYALAAAVAVLAFDSVAGKNKSIAKLTLFVILGTLLFELLNDTHAGQSLLFREENFLGSNPASGIRMVVNAIITWAVLSIWPAKEKKE
jgi:uncharacterized membrane protein YgdD (TMEM256/DUF423 family)